jgi:hypothetical protein
MRGHISIYLGVCVTYRRVLDIWPDLLHTYKTCCFIPQTTMTHHVFSFTSSSTAISRDSLSSISEREREREGERFTLGRAVYSQSIHLDDKPLETHEQWFCFPTEHLRLYSLSNFTLLENKIGRRLMFRFIGILEDGYISDNYFNKICAIFSFARLRTDCI